MSEELCWLCDGKVWIFKLWFVLFYIHNRNVTLTLYKLNSFYINLQVNGSVLYNVRYDGCIWYQPLGELYDSTSEELRNAFPWDQRKEDLDIWTKPPEFRKVPIASECEFVEPPVQMRPQKPKMARVEGLHSCSMRLKCTLLRARSVHTLTSSVYFTNALFIFFVCKKILVQKCKIST